MNQQPDLILERQPGGIFLPRDRAAPNSGDKAPANLKLELLALEERVLYSAVPLDPLPNQVDSEPTTEPLNLEWQLANLEHWAELLEAGENDQLDSMAQPNMEQETSPDSGDILVVVDRGIANYEQLVNDIQTRLSSEHSLLLIDSSADGWQQLTQYLAGRIGIQEIHLFSHAVSGELQLGTARVDFDDLLSDETSAIWQRALQPDADILLYGCELAAAPSGLAFVAQFALFSGADVAASVDQTGTGPAADWDLEFGVGQLDSYTLFASGDALTWQGVLDAQNVALANAQVLSGLDRGSADAVAMHSDGSYVIVWSHDLSGSWGIRAARFHANGTQNGGLISVNQTTAGDQRYASIDMDAAGNFVITWTSPSESPGSADIWARWYGASSGSSNEFLVNSSTPSGQFNSSVSMAGDGRFAIAWEGNGVEDSQGIYVRLYDASRNPLGNQIFVNSSSGGSQEDPIVSMNDSGAFVVSWHDETSFYYQRFDSSGNKVGSSITVSSTGTARHGDILLNNDGTVVLTWQEYNGSMWDVFWQRNASNDSTLTAKTLIRSNTTTDQLAPSVDGNGDGNFVIAWEAGEFSDTWGVFYQLYTPAGLATPFTFWANDNYSSDYQGNASVAVNSLEQYVVVWSGQSSFDSNDIGHNNVLNRFPLPLADTATAIENGGYNNSTPGTGASGNVLGNDTDPDPGDSLSVLGVLPGISGFSSSNLGASLAGQYGSLLLNSDGEYTYAIDNSNSSVQGLRTNSDTLTDTFTYTVRDQRGMVSTATLTITIRGRNDAPTALADAATAVESGGLNNGTAGTNPSGNALANDTDPDLGDSQSVSGVAAGVQASATGSVGTAVGGFYGSLTMAADGTFSYTVDNSNPTVQALRTSSQTLTDVFTYTISDAGGLTSTSQITFTIQGANDTPTLLALTPPTIAENAANGTLVTIASATEVDSSDSLTFSLSNNAGGRFTINSSTGAITIADGALLNYESATSHSITIRVTDSAGAFSEQALTINLSDVNEFAIGAVSDSNGLSNTVAENAANGTAVRITASATDADGSAVITYSLDDNAGGRFAINSSTGIVTKASLLDFETATSHTITVRATSSDGSFSTANFTIAITDVNEFAPSTPIDNDPAANEVVENSPAGTLVGVTAYSFDADGSNNTITYSLTNSALGRFAIDSSTGVVTLTSLSVNYEQATSHNITVRALSSDGSSTSQTFTVNVLNGGNEINEISDTNSASDTLAENAALGSSVITASSSHSDGLAIAYSLINDAGGRFAINSSTGVVTLVAALNYETGTSHAITVRADATDGSFAAQTFTISVLDIDEFDVGTITDSNATANSIAENSANGTLCRITAFASDPDGTTNTITYSLTDNAGGRFAINASTGVVTVANSTLLNFEAATSHTITVRATSADTSFSTQNFTINLTDVDEFDVGPLSDANPAANSIAENAANGTSVGLTASASDADATTNTITYSLDNSAGGRFAINAATGVVTVANGTLLDFEAAASHSITVRATSADGSFSTQAFTINLTDVDEFDVGPLSDANPAANSIAENAANGTSVGLTASASDADATTNTITYSLDNSADGRFAINASTGVVTVANGTLLDFEAAASHTITIRATSADGSFSTQAFTINLTDVDEFDVGPVGDTNPAANSIAENAANGTSVGLTASASDADATTNTITYSLDDSADGRFAINASTGVVTVTNGTLLDFEAAASHTITIRATSADGSFSTQAFTINLTDVDEFDVGPVGDTNPAANSIAENAANGTSVGLTASASDADATTNTITYSLDNSADGRFAINASTGVVTVANGTLLDFESATSHTITVRAASTDGSSSSQTFTINVTNVNEGPVASNDSAVAVEAGGVSNATPGTNPTGNVLDNDTDPDSTDSKTVIGVAAGLPATASGQVGQTVFGQYGNLVIHSDGSYAYTLDNSNSAVQALRTSGDALVDTFTYTMADAANSQSTARLSILITGVNDAPTAQWSEAGLSINAGSSNNQYVELTDFDQLIGGKTSFTMRLSISTTQSTFFLFSYASTSDDNEFRIYSYDGKLRLSFDNQNWNTGIDSASVADGQRHEIVVVRNSALAQFKVFIDGQLQAQHNSFKSFVNAESGGIAMLAQEQDSKGGEFDSSQYFRGTVWDLSFYDEAWTNTRVASETGRVDTNDGNLRGYWNFNQLNGSQIVEQVAGRDGILKSISGGGWVAGAAQIMQTDWLASTREHPGNGFSLGTFEAADLDSAEFISWTLSDDAGGRFAINSSTGELTVADSALLDRETAGSFQITAIATDLAGGSLTRTYTIQVTDVDEFDVGLITDGNAASNQVAENASNGTLIGLTAIANDGDATNSTITFSLDSSAGGRFAINASTGVVTVANGSLLNREESASHTITVRATSADGSFSTQSFTINVDDVDEFDVSAISDANPTANSVGENAANGSLVGITALATDLDATNSAITYSLDQSAGGRFAIDSSTGTVTVANSSLLNYEVATSHSIIVRATSADGSFSTQSLTINLTDIDEFDVGEVTDSNPTSNIVAENSANGTTVGISASASDADGTTNSITYSLDDDAGGRFAIDTSTGVVTVANGSLLDREASSSHSVTIRATSADGSFSTSTLAIEVANENEAPVASADQGTASEAGGFGNSSGGTNASGNVLANDLDPDAGDHLTVIGVQAGTNPPPAGPVGVSISGTYGTLLLNANGSYTYTINNAHPDVEALRTASDSLQDTFAYRMRDADGLESTSQLVLTITGTNDTPYSMWSETGVGINFEPANNQYMRVSDFGNLLADDQFTLRLAISTNESSGTFFSYASSSDHNELRLHLSNGKLRVYLDGQQWVTNIATSLIADGQRHEVCVVRTVASGKVDVFIDGKLRDSKSNWKTGHRLDAGGSMVLGQDQDSIGGSFNPDETFHGTFWDLSVYSSAWDEVRLNLAGGQTEHSAPDLKGHWDFDLLGSNAILDLIGGRHGVLLSITPSSEWIAGEAAIVQADWKPRIAENSVTGRVVSNLQAQDIDAGESLTWSLSDDAGGRFAIDSSTGLLTVANGELLNYEQHQTHTVIVRVTDAGGLFREEAYTIQLTDVQETGVSVPVDLDPSANRVSENAATGTSTGLQAWAIDEDGTTNVVTYSLLDNAGDRFTIDSNNGIVSVLNGSLLDREQAASHQITVRATSADGTFEDKVFTIQLIDVDEFDTGTTADLDPAPNTVAENSSAGSSVGIQANASDSDATLSAISYSLDNDAGGRFVIDSQTGIVTVADAGLLDYETAASHTITVRSTSQDGSTSITSFTIQLTDVNEFGIGPITDSDPVGNLVFENSVAGTYAGITAFAQDLDATFNQISWRLLNDDGGRFAIDPLTGQISTTQPLDFESLGSIRYVQVEGSSSDGSRSQQVFEIRIGDVLTESYRVFSGLNVTMTPQELLRSASETGEQYQTLSFTDTPSFGQLFVINAQGKQAVTVADLSQLAIPVGQQIIYEAPIANSGTVTLGYSAMTSNGLSRTGTVTIQVEPAVIAAPAAPPSSAFNSSAFSSNSGSGDSSSSSSPRAGQSSQTQPAYTGETSTNSSGGGDSAATGGALQAAVGPLPGSGSGSFGEVDDQSAESDSATGESANHSGDDSRRDKEERNQAAERIASNLQLSLGISQAGGPNSLRGAGDGIGATRVLASAATIQQELFATAQFSEYLDKLDSALEETPFIVGFEMPTYATAGASLFTVGYVAWLIRGGVLLTSFMSSIPSWQSFDPLPILENAGSGDDEFNADGSDSSIAELVDSEQPDSTMAISPG